MRPVPWHVKGVHPDAREVAREAARRSGVSVGTWLNALIVEAADKDIPPGKPEAPAPHGAGPAHNPRAAATPPGDDPIAAIGRQIDELKWRIDSLSRDDSARHAGHFAIDARPVCHAGKTGTTRGSEFRLRLPRLALTWASS